MDKSVRIEATGNEVRAANDCMVAALNNLAGPYGKAHGRCMSDLYYACYHLASALLLSRGIAPASHEAVQTLLALHFVKPAALPQDTVGRLNELMSMRHVADYKPHIAIRSGDIERFRPWIVGFVREALRLLGKAAPEAEAGALQRAANDFDKIALE